MRSQEPDSASRPDVLACVGDNIRRLRQEAGLSQAALAEASGLSRRMIVGIESGEANISLSNLDRIAAALGTSFSHLVRAPEAQDGTRIRSLLWQGETPESRAVLLGTAPAVSEVEMWTWALAPGERYEGETAASVGWSEMLYVLEGVLEVEMEGGTRRVETGDFLIFRSDRPYMFVNVGTGTLRFIRSLAI
ncbi:helix-turn-helix domain-containing protein [Aquabacter cavernae]|uniref:helix-turn-helix domain-containing protein n=1 Tax=Aquabacter cavernae TaxID=2496029 RepID=UPI001FDF0C51|nr:XRE family transcriptional regulator [Aquabacter cavernae]